MSTVCDRPAERRQSRSWDRERINAALHQWSENHHGWTPSKRTAAMDRTLPDPRTVCVYYPSWNAALRDAGLEPLTHQQSWTREQVVDSLRGWAREHPGEPLTRKDIDADTEMPGYHTIRRLFGTAAEAFTLAGLPTRRPGPLECWTRERVLDSLRGWAREHPGESLTRRQLAADPELPSDQALRRLFGTPAAAFDAAGLPPRERRRRTTRPQAFRNGVLYLRCSQCRGWLPADKQFSVIGRDENGTPRRWHSWCHGCHAESRSFAQERQQREQREAIEREILRGQAAEATAAIEHYRRQTLKPIQDRHAPRREGEKTRLDVEPFARWLEQLIARHGGPVEVGALIGMQERQVRTITGRVYRRVHVDVVDRALVTYGGCETLDDLYPFEQAA